MAPKRQTKATAAVQSQTPPLDGCTIAVSGTFPGTTQGAIGQLVWKLGAVFVKSVTQECTHLVATPSEVQRRTTKVLAALGHSDVQIVGLSWIQASEEANTKAPESPHLIGSAPAPVAPPATTSGKVNGQAKRSASPDALPNAPLKRQKTQPAVKPNDADAKKANAASRAKPTNVPQDEGVNSPTHRVYIGPDGTIYDASLNQTNSSNNNNKFYRVQVGNLSKSSLSHRADSVTGSTSAVHRLFLYVDQMG